MYKSEGFFISWIRLDTALENHELKKLIYENLVRRVTVLPMYPLCKSPYIRSMYTLRNRQHIRSTFMVQKH